jgi:mRNA interferase MazF
MVSRYIPDQGDIVWLEFDPQAGHEQAGQRPAVVLSRKPYNQKTGLAICCPITSRVKGYPFEVRLNGKKIDGAILSDQVKSLDWQARGAKFIEKINAATLTEATGKLMSIIE